MYFIYPCKVPTRRNALANNHIHSRWNILSKNSGSTLAQLWVSEPKLFVLQFSRNSGLYFCYRIELHHHRKSQLGKKCILSVQKHIHLLVIFPSFIQFFKPSLCLAYGYMWRLINIEVEEKSLKCLWALLREIPRVFNLVP